MNNDLELKLKVFSGPLDLLLHLIKKLEIDIYDIPIATITNQYMEYINHIKENQLEIAGDYIVMASTLMAIKSKMLIPISEVQVDEELEEYEDPRQPLVDQLIIYQKFQEASIFLDDLQQKQLFFYTKEASNLSKFQDENIQLPKDYIKINDLQTIFQEMMTNLNQDTELSIKPDNHTIDETVTSLKEKLKINKSIKFIDLFQEYNKNNVVLNFLAMLELVKKDYISISQSNLYKDIYLQLK